MFKTSSRKRKNANKAANVKGGKSIDVKEWEIQAFVSTQLNRHGILHHGDQNAAKRSYAQAAIAKATGLKKGWPDMVVIPDYQIIIFFEFKTMNGKQSEAQAEVEEQLISYGFPYYIVKTNDKQEAWNIVKEFIEKHA